MNFKLLNHSIELNIKYFFGIQIWEGRNSEPIIQFSYSGFPYIKLNLIIRNFVKYRICQKPYYMIFDSTVAQYHYSINSDIYNPDSF
jgi:hypothetical protein